MKTILFLLLIFIYPPIQEHTILVSGKYDEELHIAYNPQTSSVTGYFSSATGYDENTDKPKFTCKFYLEGKFENNKVIVKTYYPLSKSTDVISGTINVVDSSDLSIQLAEEHGGCWNVQPFSKESIGFRLTEKQHWIEIRYVLTEKSNFYSDKSEAAIRKAYLVKGDIVYIEKVEGNWAYCLFYGAKTTAGWMKVESLNKL